MKKERLIILVLVVFILLIEHVLALDPCKSGELTTSAHKDYQMVYTNESFIRLDNKDLLKDLEQLRDLICLQYLDATDHGIKGDAANLKKLTNLEVLSLYSNPEVYGDICSLSGATKLRILKFAFDPKVYGDISCLKNLNLETFAMTYTKIYGDLSNLSHMTNLKAVYISGTDISGDISHLNQLTNLEELGISDEYPGNPNITGDLASLDNLTKLKKVSMYSTKTTNCEHFTKMHPNIQQGGCSKESLKTLEVHNIRAEKKIGKDRYEGPPPDYRNEANERADDRQDETFEERNDKGNIFTRFFGWFKNLFRKSQDLPLDGNKQFGKPENDEEESYDNVPRDVNRQRPQAGPGGCRSQAECDAFCSKPENNEACSKFAKPEGPDGEERQPQGEKGACQSEEECDALIKKYLAENK